MEPSNPLNRYELLDYINEVSNGLAHTGSIEWTMQGESSEDSEALGISEPENYIRSHTRSHINYIEYSILNINMLRAFFLELLSTSTLSAINSRARSSEELISQSNTIQNYKSDIKKFSQFLIKSNFPLEAPSLTYDDHVLLYKAYLISRFAPKTVARNIIALRRYFDFLLDRKIVTVNIFNKIKIKNPLVIHPTNALNEDQIKKIFELIDANENRIIRIFDKMVLSLFLGTGARKSELLALKRSDISTRQGVPIIILYGKGGKTREVPIISAVVKSINDYLEMMKENGKEILPFDQLIQNQYNNNKSCSLVTLERIVKKYIKLAGIEERITPHSLRASVISHLYIKGIDVVDISQYVGHASVDTTKVYIKRSRDLKDSPGLKISLL